MAIIKTDDALSQLPQNLLQILVNKEQLALSKEDLKIRQGDFKLRQEEAIREREMQEAEMRGAVAAAGLMAQLNPTFGRAAPTDPRALPSFMENIQGLRMGEAQIGNEELRGSILGDQVRLNSATLDERIAAPSLANNFQRAQTVRLQAETQGVNLDNALQQARFANDPQRVGQAWQLMLSGQVTWDQAASAAGITDRSALPPDFTLALPSAAGGEAAQKASSLFRVMKASSMTMDSLVDAGTEINLFGSINRSSRNPFTEWASGKFLSQEEKQLIQAHKTFSDAYRFFISGQQSSDAEASRLLFTVLENPGDEAPVIQQKRFMRAMIMNMAQEVAGGALNPEQAATQLLNTAISRGLPEDQIEIYRQQLEDARIYNASGGHLGGGLSLSADPVTPETLPGAIERVDGLIDRTLAPGGRR